MRWEYRTWQAKHFEITLDEAIVEVNLLGQGGWELINVDNGRFWFKRPIQDTNKYPVGH